MRPLEIISFIISDNAGRNNVEERSLVSGIEVEKFICVENKVSELLNASFILSEEIDNWRSIIIEVEAGDKASRLHLFKKCISSMGIYAKYWIFVHVIGLLISALIIAMRCMGYMFPNVRDDLSRNAGDRGATTEGAE